MRCSAGKTEAIKSGWTPRLSIDWGTILFPPIVFISFPIPRRNPSTTNSTFHVKKHEYWSILVSRDVLVFVHLLSSTSLLQPIVQRYLLISTKFDNMANSKLHPCVHDVRIVFPLTQFVWLLEERGIKWRLQWSRFCCVSHIKSSLLPFPHSSPSPSSFDLFLYHGSSSRFFHPSPHLRHRRSPMQQLVERGQVPENVAARYFRGEGLEIPAHKAVVSGDEGRQDGDHKDPRVSFWEDLAMRDADVSTSFSSIFPSFSLLILFSIASHLFSNFTTDLLSSIPCQVYYLPSVLEVCSLEQTLYQSIWPNKLLTSRLVWKREMKTLISTLESWLQRQPNVISKKEVWSAIYSSLWLVFFNTWTSQLLTRLDSRLFQVTTQIINTKLQVQLMSEVSAQPWSE